MLAGVWHACVLSDPDNSAQRQNSLPHSLPSSRRASSQLPWAVHCKTSHRRFIDGVRSHIALVLCWFEVNSPGLCRQVLLHSHLSDVKADRNRNVRIFTKRHVYVRTECVELIISYVWCRITYQCVLYVLLVPHTMLSFSHIPALSVIHNIVLTSCIRLADDTAVLEHSLEVCHQAQA